LIAALELAPTTPSFNKAAEAICCREWRTLESGVHLVNLEIASLVKGSETPAGDGVSGAVRCVLVLPNGSKRAAVLKRGPLGEIVAEAFGAMLLRAWGLPVPDPFLVDEGGVIAFASADIGYPNLKQSLGLEAIPEGPAFDAAVRVAIDLACTLPTTPLATACDEAIENRDRNLGNILWDGRDEAWIDHALSLGQGSHLKDTNKLCAFSIGTPHQERIRRASVAQGLLLDRASPPLVDAALSRSALGPIFLAPFVSARLTALGNLLLARFPQPPDLLSN
jgi:hypothetical protein